MPRTLKSQWPVVIVIVSFLALVSLLVLDAERRNAGTMVYALDDAYIHMAIAKSAGEYGTWGITRFEFTSATSSPLWTALIAAVYSLIGTSAFVPLVLNVIAGIALLCVSGAALARNLLDSRLVFCGLLSVLLITPMPALALSGMEHLLHAAIAVAVSYLASSILTGESNAHHERLLIAAAPLLTSLRYEGLFELLVVCGALVIAKRRWQLAFAIGAAGALPIVLYGLWSMSHGWQFFPNSVLLKAVRPDFSFRGVARMVTGQQAVATLYRTPHLLVLVVAALALLFRSSRRGRAWDHPSFALVLFVGTALLHAQFADVGWFYRYEAYLVALGIVAHWESVESYAVPEFRTMKALPRLAIAAVLAIIVLRPLELRARASLLMASRASTNIFEQQYQMGQFLNASYRGSTVAVNDIGAVAYLGSDLRIVDLWGLASRDVASLRMTNSYDSDAIQSLANLADVKVAVVYDRWFERFGGIPKQWHKVGAWTIANNVVAGGDTVSFYAVDPSERERLAENLRSFARRMPPSVRQTGEYVLGNSFVSNSVARE